MKSPKISAKTRLWLEIDKETFLGFGRVQLLEAIHNTGSIRKAAMSLNMSYMKAWKLIDQINERANEPLVLCSTGGKKGGGAELSPHGKEMIESFQKLNKRCEDFVDKELSKVFEDV